MDISAYVYDISVYGCIGQFVINIDSSSVAGVYLKESSLGTDFVWTGGYLDVSIDTHDASIDSLYEYVEDLSTAINTHNTQDPSIQEIYDVGLWGILDHTSQGEQLLEVDYTPGSLNTISSARLVAGSGIDFDTSIDDTGHLSYLTINASVSIPEVVGYVKESSLGTDFAWVGGLLDVSIVGADVTKAYVDGSLATRDSSITDLYNIKVNKTLFDSSILAQTNWNTSQDSSIVAIRNITTSQDASIVAIRNIDSAQDASIVAIRNINTSQDSSIVALRLKDTQIDASIVRIDTSINNTITITEVSIGSGLYWNGSILDVSTGYALTSSINSSLGLYYTKTQVDSSFALKTDVPSGVLKESSLGTDFYWQSGLLEVSINGMDYAYIDGSLATRDASIQDLYDYTLDLSTYTYSHTHTQDASIETLFAENDIQDASLLNRLSYILDAVQTGYTLVENSGTIISGVKRATIRTLSPSTGITIQDDLEYGKLYIGVDHTQDASIAGAYTYIIDLSTKTSYWKTYTDGSIATIKATYIPSASLGTDFYWNSGSVDISTIDIENYFLLNSTDTFTGTLTLDGSIKIGDASNGNYTSIGKDGTIKLYGNATAFEDLVVPLVGTKQGNQINALPTFDYDQLAYLFPANDTTQILYFTVQLPHKWKVGSRLYPHVHYRQTIAANKPIFKLDYKFANMGTSMPSAWNTYTMDNSVYAWVDSSTHQLAVGTGGVDASSYNISALMLCKLYRDDTSTGDIPAWQFDINYEIDSLGSSTEYIK